METQGASADRTSARHGAYLVGLVAPPALLTPMVVMQFEEILNTAFPERYPGRLCVLRADPTGEGWLAAESANIHGEVDLTLTLDTLDARGSVFASSGYVFGIHELSELLDRCSDASDVSGVPPLDGDGDGVGSFCSRLFRYAEARRARLADLELSHEPAYSTTTSGMLDAATNLAHAIRRFAVGGMTAALRDPRLTTPTRLRGFTAAVSGH